MHARMTLIGMQTALLANDKRFADTWSLTNESYDKDTLLAAIIQTGATFEPLYTDPDYFYTMSGYWWSRWSRTFEKWFDAFDIEYSPLENYDRFEQWHEDTLDTGSESTEHSTDTTIDTDTTDTGRITEVTDEDLTNNSTENGTVDTDRDAHTDTTTNTVSAYDSSSYSPHDKSETNYGRDHNVVETQNHTVNSTGTDDKTVTTNTSNTGTLDTTQNVEGTSATDRSNDRDHDHTGRIHGNIGVTTSQQMLQSELEIQAWNIYQHIADIFCKEMLISVY